MERALREGREGADRLHLVPEELDPERLAAGRREDVDDAAAHGELAALVGALDALVAGEGKVLGERVDARVVAYCDLEAGRTRRGRRHALGERDRGDADQATCGQHVERPGPFADEVRRRLEP